MNHHLKFILDAVVCRCTISKHGDTVSLGCDDPDHAEQVFEAMERLADLADEVGFFEMEEL